MAAVMGVVVTDGDGDDNRNEKGPKCTKRPSSRIDTPQSLQYTVIEKSLIPPRRVQSALDSGKGRNGTKGRGKGKRHSKGTLQAQQRPPRLPPYGTLPLAARRLH